MEGSRRPCRFAQEQSRRASPIDTPTHSYDGSRASFIDARTIDDIIDRIELFAPLSAESSQIAAVVVQRGAGYVLFGPPGRGKSQTIANAITNSPAHEKTVLLVAATPPSI
ncbi:hypothetical protein [Bradyrhizobium japonicum]|uniref:hypothetical protein n=1 Tax=Bradyrhizobium japonicum TaxID=375 RepID=UPI001180FA0D|nr:hypothetical protein [Bradyrhizobium japonicum]